MLHKLNKNILIQLIVNLNDFNKFSTEELENKKREIENILEMRKDENNDIYHIEDDWHIIPFVNFRNNSKDNYLILKHENEEKNITIEWKSDSPIDMSVIYKKKIFLPTSIPIGGIVDNIRLIHKRKDNLYDFLIIGKSNDPSKNTYWVLIGKKFTVSQLWEQDLYYIPHKKLKYSL